MKPMRFYGTLVVGKAEAWLKHIKKKLDSLKVPPELRVRLATHVLEGEANKWWEIVKRQVG